MLPNLVEVSSAKKGPPALVPYEYLSLLPNSSIKREMMTASIDTIFDGEV